MAINRRFRARTPVPKVEDIEAAGGHVTRAQAVALIADLMPDVIDEGLRRNCVQKSIGRHTKSGKLLATARGKYDLSEVLEWASRVWQRVDVTQIRKKLNPRPTSGEAMLQLPALVAQGRIVSLPSTLDECHRRIEEYDEKVVQLSDALAFLTQELELRDRRTR